MSSSPTLILIHGAWHYPSQWDKLLPFLTLQSFKTVVADNPSTHGDPSVTFADDVSYIESLIDHEVSLGNKVVLVGHSYGGCLAQSAVKKFRVHVKGLVLISSFFQETEKTQLETWGGTLPPFLKFENGVVERLFDAKAIFYHDMESDEADEYVAKLRLQSERSCTQGGEAAYSGWKDVPVWLLITAKDLSLPTDLQRMLAAKGKEVEGVDITIEEVDAGHAPFLSKPKETADFIVRAVAALQ